MSQKENKEEPNKTMAQAGVDQAIAKLVDTFDAQSAKEHEEMYNLFCDRDSWLVAAERYPKTTQLLAIIGFMEVTKSREAKKKFQEEHAE